MLTADDFKKLIQVFATREELRQELEKIREEMATKEDFRKVMTVLDKVLKEVLDMRQEQSFHIQSHDDIRGEITVIQKKLNQLTTS